MECNKKIIIITKYRKASGRNQHQRNYSFFHFFFYGLNLEWSKEYQPIFSWNDFNEKPKKGSLLIAKYGKGYYTYTRKKPTRVGVEAFSYVASYSWSNVPLIEPFFIVGAL